MRLVYLPHKHPSLHGRLSLHSVATLLHLSGLPSHRALRLLHRPHHLGHAIVRTASLLRLQPRRSLRRPKPIELRPLRHELLIARRYMVIEQPRGSARAHLGLHHQPREVNHNGINGDDLVFQSMVTRPCQPNETCSARRRGNSPSKLPLSHPRIR